MRKLLSNILILLGACTITSGLTLWITTLRLIALQKHVVDNYLSSVRDPEIIAGLKYVPRVLMRVYLAGGYCQQNDAMIVICGLGLIMIVVGVYLRQTTKGNGCTAQPVVGEIQSFQFFSKNTRLWISIVLMTLTWSFFLTVIVTFGSWKDLSNPTADFIYVLVACLIPLQLIRYFRKLRGPP